MRRLVVVLLWAAVMPAFGIEVLSAAEGRFVGEVVAKWLPNGRDMQLTEPLQYMDRRGSAWKVPAGTTVDGASIPKALWGVVGPPFAGKYRKASVVHDYYCQTMSRPWREVHEVFYEASLTEGNSQYHARLMYGAVYAWGPRWEVQDGRPVRLRGVVRSPTEAEVQELADWVKRGDPSLAEIAGFTERRFPRTSPMTAKRVALVVGNSAYQHTPRLDNPRNDATDVAAVLKASGFRVIDGFDLGKSAFDQKVREFSAALSGAEAGVFFYAGHGLQVSGKNYLVPIDAKLEDAASLDFEMVLLDLVHRTMERQTNTNILFLDACRDNPLARNLARAMGTRSAEIGRGLASVESGAGTLISFSTQPGNVALDGAGRNSPFTGSLVKHVSSSSDDLSAILIAVRNDVMKETQRKQVPWEHSSLTGRFYFSGAPPPPQLPPMSAQRDKGELERAAAFIKETEDQGRLEAFIEQFGDTPYAGMARARLQELRNRQEVALARPRAEHRREHAFDGTWEVTTITGASCPNPGTRRERDYTIRISGAKIEISDTAVGKVSAQGDFEFIVSRKPTQRKMDPTDRNIIRGRLQADSGQGTFGWLKRGVEPGCRGSVFLKKDEKVTSTTPPPVPAEDKGQHAFDGSWEVSGIPENCHLNKRWRWTEALRISGSEVVEARGFIGKHGQVSKDGDLKFSVQGARSPPRLGTFTGKLLADSGRGRYRYPDCAGPQRDRCCSGTLILKKL